MFIYLPDTEKIWLKVVEERIRRNSESALTRYYIRAKAPTIKTEKDNDLINELTETSKLSVQQSQCYTLYGQDDSSTVYFPNTVEFSYLPITMLLVEQPAENNCLPAVQVKQEEKVAQKEEKFKWPGVQEVMESYHRYVKGMYRLFVMHL